MAHRNAYADLKRAWREAQLKSSKQKVSYMGSRLGWAKSDLARLQVAEYLARLETFKEQSVTIKQVLNDGKWKEGIGTIEEAESVIGMAEAAVANAKKLKVRQIAKKVMD